jgi:hypothetical protein
MEKNITILVSGFVTMGIITSLLLPNRHFGTVAKNVGSAVNQVQYTAITGKK